MSGLSHINKDDLENELNAINNDIASIPVAAGPKKNRFDELEDMIT